MTVPAYSIAASYFHWIVAVPMIGTIATVLKAQKAPKEEKGMWMHRHKSLGLLTGMLVAPRVAYRVMNAAKFRTEHLVGSGPLETKAGKFTHYLLYGFMTAMPVTGIAMGYYGGKGLPFFKTTIPGIQHTEENKAAHMDIAKKSFKIHKQIGTYGKYLVPLHVAGGVQHWMRGQAIFTRINPFRSVPKH